MRLRTLVLCVAAIAFPTMAHANLTLEQSFTLETSWISPGAGGITSGGSGLWVVAYDGTHVTNYDASGNLLTSWNTNIEETADVFDRGIGVDGAGFVYVMTASFEAGAYVRKYQPDGTLLSAERFEFPPKLGFIVDAEGHIHGGDDSFDDRKALFALGPDGTRYISDLKSYNTPLNAHGPGSTMVPVQDKCGGPTNIETSCYVASHAAATESRLYVAGYWCDDQSVCGYAIHMFGPGASQLGSIPQHGHDPLALGLSGTVYVLTGGQVVEKWVPAGITPTIESSWGAVKARWR